MTGRGQREGSVITRRDIGRGLVAAALLPAWPAAAQRRPGGYGRFPTVLAENGEGETLNLPGELRGRLVVVSLALNPRRQRDMAAWAARIAPLTARTKEIYHYQVLVAGRRGTLERYLIDNNLRASSGSAEALRNTFAVYEAPNAFRRSLALPGGEEVFVLLISPTGTVYWRADGRVTPRKLAALQKEVDRLTGAGLVSRLDL